MNSTQTNPFEVLGIHPRGLKKLNHDQIESVVSAMYRTLSKHFHPDGGSAAASAKHFKLVNDAYMELTSDPEALKYWLTSLRSGGKKQRETLEQEIKKLRATKAMLDARALSVRWRSRRRWG